MSLAARWTAILDDLRAHDRYRQLTAPQGVDFASNDYLGYTSRTGPPQSASGLPRSGSASRLLRGNHPVWEEVETLLAQWHRAESALVFHSGYAANEGLLSTVVEPQDWAASDELNHASIIDGLRLSRAERFLFKHNDLDHLEGGLRSASSARPANRQLFIVTESLFGMEGDLAPLEEMARLADRYDAHLIVDEAHATGCFGPDGSGLVDAAGLRTRVLATVHTGGKALGVAGAYVCGPSRLKELLVNRCRQLVFTTALPPAVGSWWLDAIARVQADAEGRRELRAAAARFRAELNARGVAALGSAYVVPVVLGEDRLAVRAARALGASGYDIRAIRPPSVPCGSARLRIAIHADHAGAILASAADAVAACTGASQ